VYNIELQKSWPDSSWNVFANSGLESICKVNR
jgi:hypothetical protein